MSTISLKELEELLQDSDREYIRDDFLMAPISIKEDHQVMSFEDTISSKFTLSLFSDRQYKPSNTSQARQSAARHIHNTIYGEILGGLRHLKYNAEYLSREDVVSLVDSLIKKVEG